MRTALLAAAITAALASAVVFTSATDRAEAAQTNIDVGNFYFCDQSSQGGVCEKTVSTGDTVVWSVSAGSHTVTECDVNYATCPPSGGFDSGALSQGQQFQRTFNSAGTFYYACVFHQQAMRGRLVVQAAQTTPTPVPTPSPAATTAPTAAPAGSPTAAIVPSTGGHPSSDGGAGTMAALAIIAGTLAVIAGAGVVYRVRPGRRP